MTVASAGSGAPPSVLVRCMRAGEFSRVRDVCVAAFGDPSLGGLVDALSSSWAWEDDLSFVAELDGEIVGQVLYVHAFLDAPERLVDVLVLSPVGVRPDLQRRGIGSRLITESLGVLSARAEPLVFLEGHPTFYPRFGFRPGWELGFTAPSVRIPKDA
ncbi:MAG TPA: N-acetyltransferase, partial [Candidatus Limnocylindria bacterium]|nr:N-acetyltransferase [Candidatus Limnocylindria bacterium]